MIRIENLCKIFHEGQPNEIYALIDINLEIKTGEFIIFKGPNGSGKSTLLSLIAAISKPSSGEVVVAEQHVSKLPDHFAAMYRREKIGFIFQKYHLIPMLSVLENILVPLMPSSEPYSDLLIKAEKVMERFAIDHKRNVAVKHLSGGEQQRVAIARAMINEPAILLADEPTANLDAALSDAFIETLNDIYRHGTTVLVATHDPVFYSLGFLSREIEMHEGRII